MLLIENLLAAAEYFDRNEWINFRKKFPDVPYVGLAQRGQKSEIYLIQYNGLSPIKHPSIIPLALPRSITQLAFPRYDPRYYETQSSRLVATNDAQRKFSAPTQLGENIEAIARQSLANRKARLYAKAIARPALKYLAERRLTSKVQQRHGDIAAATAIGLSIWYNLYTEQADLRSWQTLPAQIRLARLILEPGSYILSLNNFNAENIRIDQNDLGLVTLKAGEKRLMIIRTVR